MQNQFVVPQFLDVESKIFGPITVRQFLILIVEGLLIALFYRLFTLPLFGALTFITGGIAAAFAFFKVNGRPFHLFLINFIQTSKRPNLRMWGKEYSDDELKIFIARVPAVVAAQVVKKARPSQSHLAKLSLIVNTGGAYKGDDHHGSDVPLSFK